MSSSSKYLEMLEIYLEISTSTNKRKRAHEHDGQDDENEDPGIKSKARDEPIQPCRIRYE